MVKAVARAHQGSLQLRSRPGRGTSGDNADIHETSRRWREAGDRFRGDYTEVTLEHMLVGKAAMQLV